MKLRMLAIATLLLTAPAAAHEISKGPNGGRVVETGTHHVELVVKGRDVDVFVTDAADKAIAITGYKGVAILTVSGKSQRIELVRFPPWLSRYCF